MKIPFGKHHLFFLLLLCSFFAFWNLGTDPIMVWDESRNGVTAIEMSTNEDYLNPYYGGQPEDWSVKPPLFIWTVVLSFKALGQNAFALRFPSAVASIITLFWIFQICRLYRTSSFALATGLVLLSVKGFLGPHVGRSGDYDALLVCFLVGGLYYFLRYLDFKYSKGIYLMALLWGLAFWTKGPAAFILIPGIGLFLLLRNQLVHLLKTAIFWRAALGFLTICGTWVLAIYYYGATFQTETMEGSNAFQRIFLNDIVIRFSSTKVDSIVHLPDYGFFFTYLDARFNLWNYVFYFFLVVLFFSVLKNKKKLSHQIEFHPLLTLAFCLSFSVGLFFTIATTKHHWYMAPVLPFIAIITISGINNFWPQAKLLFGILLVFTLGRQVYQFSTPSDSPIEILQLQTAVSPSAKIGLVAPFPLQDKMWYLHSLSSSITYLPDLNHLNQQPNINQLFIHHNHLSVLDNSLWKKIETINEHVLLERVK